MNNTPLIISLLYCISALSFLFVLAIYSYGWWLAIKIKLQKRKLRKLHKELNQLNSKISVN